MSQPSTGIILVDHGSQIEESNALLTEVAKAFREKSGWEIVEPAHMELAEPSIATAFARCAEQGAKLVVVMPYLLGPGKHSSRDIPRLATEASKDFPGVDTLVTAPLGLHDLMLQIIDDRIRQSLDVNG